MMMVNHQQNRALAVLHIVVVVVVMASSKNCRTVLLSKTNYCESARRKKWPERNVMNNVGVSSNTKYLFSFLLCEIAT